MINDAAVAYRGVIPAEAWVEPARYMPAAELRGEIEDAGITFYVAVLPGAALPAAGASAGAAAEAVGACPDALAAVMGIQQREMAGCPAGSPPVTLVRHAYTRTALQGRGIGRALLRELLRRRQAATVAPRPVLVGTWAAGDWAVRFYERNGFRLVGDAAEKDRLLRTYWFCEGLGALNEPASAHRQAQMAASVVLADELWFASAASREAAAAAAEGARGEDTPQPDQ